MLARLRRMFEINGGVFFVEGAAGGAIYFPKREKIYSVNREGVRILRSYVRGEPLTKETDRTYLETLREEGLISDGFIPRPFDPPKDETLTLHFAWLELTEGCNLKCLHCYEGNDHRKRESELGLQRWKEILRELRGAGCERIQLTGGEICTVPFARELLVDAAGLGFREITVFTNATLLDREWIDLFRRCGVCVRFSLYGASPEVHDRVTATEGSFEKTTANVKSMLAQGICVSPAIVILRENQEDAENIRKFVLSLGMRYDGFDVIRCVKGGTQPVHLPTDKAALHSQYRSRPLFRVTKERFSDAMHRNTCWYGKFVVMPTGKVAPCIFERGLLLGDLSRQSVGEILQSDALKKCWLLDFSQIEECRECEYRFACKDCRPLARACGTPLAKNPRCLYDPAEGIWKKPV